MKRTSKEVSRVARALQHVVTDETRVRPSYQTCWHLAHEAVQVRGEGVGDEELACALFFENAALFGASL